MSPFVPKTSQGWTVHPDTWATVPHISTRSSKLDVATPGDLQDKSHSLFLNTDELDLLALGKLDARIALKYSDNSKRSLCEREVHYTQISSVVQIKLRPPGGELTA